jgi:hypothetical protein
MATDVYNHNSVQRNIVTVCQFCEKYGIAVNLCCGLAVTVCISGCKAHGLEAQS